MSLKIKYSKTTNNKITTNAILFCNENFNSKNIKNYLSDPEFSYISDLLKVSDIKKNLLVFELNSKKKIVLISIKKNIKLSDVENLGAGLYSRINYGKNSEYSIISDSIKSNISNFLGHFLHGLKLKSYEFKKYKKQKK